MGIKTGREYIERIDAARSEVWIRGARIEGRLSEHPAYRGVMKTQAELYDLQHAEENAELLTYRSPQTGVRVGLSFLPPRTAEDLVRRRIMIQEWALHTHGFIGRSPDYMNSVVMLLGETAELFAAGDPAFVRHARDYASYCRERDITLTHSFIRPQTNRSRSFMDSSNRDTASARVVEKTKRGIVVQGALLLATQGGMTDELYVFPGPCPPGDRRDNPYAFAFAIPCNTPGVKFVCRDSYDSGRSSFDAPLSSRFEEMDTAVVFDKVLVPWERVFLCGDAETANAYPLKSNYYSHIAHQVACRRIVKLEFMLGLIEALVTALSIDEYDHIQEKTAEAIVALETMKALLYAAEADSVPDEWGLMMPDPRPLNAACHYFAAVYPRLAEIVQLIGASGLIATPAEADFQTAELRPHLDAYLQTGTLDAEQRTGLFRLAWDATMSAFGTRQTQYERFFFGDPVRMARRLSSSYDKERYVDRVRSMLARTRSSGT
jgi:4-hydroxyphenylacetate 3-monooxygenase